MNTKEIVLIDLSSLAYPIWHMSQSEPDPNHASTAIAARVRALAQGHDYVAVCCDSGRTFRHDVSAEYKAQRAEKDAPLIHQIELAKDQLRADGFPIWSAPGFEADDIIASAAAWAMRGPDLTVLVVSADKDLLQLVGARVTALSPTSGKKFDAEAVGVKFGVTPAQMTDYLMLVGDTSDNIKGAKGIGGVKASQLLAKFGDLDSVYEQLDTKGGASLGLPASVVAALKDFQPRLAVTRELVTLRMDVELPFDLILQPRAPQAALAFDVNALEEPEAQTEPERPLAIVRPVEGPEPGSITRFTKCDGNHAGPPCADPHCWNDGLDKAIAPLAASGEAQGLVKREVLTPEVVNWERGLDPRTMTEARIVAKDLYDSRMFGAYGTPQAVLTTIMVGRELGLPAMASLRCIHNIEGKHTLSASLMAAIVLKSGFAEYFEPVTLSDKEVTYRTLRKGARAEVTLTHTIEMARQAWPKSKTDWEKSFEASGWGRNSTDMLVARCQSRLARLVYPDLLANLYTAEELKEIKESQVA